MGVHVIGDENTVLGFALVGIEGTVVTTEDEARTALEDAVVDSLMHVKEKHDSNRT